MRVIASAVLEGDGFSTKVSLPATLGRKNYTATISGSTLFIKLNDSEYAHSVVLLTPNITGPLSSGERTISNRGGAIVIG